MAKTIKIDYIVTSLDRYGRKRLEEELFKFKVSSKQIFVVYSHYGLWQILKDLTYKIDLRCDVNVQQRFNYQLMKTNDFEYIVKKI